MSKTGVTVLGNIVTDVTPPHLLPYTLRSNVTLKGRDQTRQVYQEVSVSPPQYVGQIISLQCAFESSSSK